jgi:hypothetical protein
MENWPMYEKLFGRVPFLVLPLVSMVCLTCFSESASAVSMRVSIGQVNYVAEIVYDAKEFRAWVYTGEVPKDVDLVHEPIILAKLYAGTQAFIFIENLVEKEASFSLLRSNTEYANATQKELEKISDVEQHSALVTKMTGRLIGAYVSGGSALQLNISDLALELTNAVFSFQDLADIIMLSEIGLASSLIEDALLLVDSLPMSNPEAIIVDIAQYILAADNIVNGVDYFTDISLRMAQDKRINTTLREDALKFGFNLADGFISVFVPNTGKTAVVAAQWARHLFSGVGIVSTAIDVTNVLKAHYERKLAIHNKGFYGASADKVFEYSNFFVKRQVTEQELDSSVLIEVKETDILKVISGPSTEDVSDARFYVVGTVLIEGYEGSQGIKVVLSESLPFDVSFGYSVYSFSTSDPTEATELGDFQPALNKRFIIPAGQSYGVVPVVVIDDDVEESLSEKFRFAVYDVNGATLPHGRYNDVYTGVIVDDDYIIDNTPIILNDPTDGLIDGNPPLPVTTSGCNLTALSVGTEVPGSTANSQIDMEYTVANAGDSVCRGGLVRVMIADSLDDSSLSYSADNFAIPALEAGERRTRYRNDVRLPNIGNGSKYLGIEVSPLLGDEDNSNDNRVFVPFVIGTGIAGLSDLRVTVDDAYIGDVEEPIVLWNSIVRLPYTIKANAEGSPPYRYSIVLSKDEYISVDDVVLQTLDSNNDRGLGYHGNHHYDREVLVPTGVARGFWYLIVQVDPFNEIDESNESNNARATPIIIEDSLVDESNGFPNLYADGFNIENRVLTNAELLKYSIFTVPSSPSVPLYDDSKTSYITHDVCLALSADIVLDDTDIIFHRYPDVLQQPLGGISGATVSFPAPKWLSDPDFGTGAYYIFAKIDCGDSIVENDEADNVAGPIEIFYIADASKTVIATDETVFVYAGDIMTTNLLANDQSSILQSLSIDFFADQRPTVSEPISYVEQDTGLTMMVEDDGTITIDASSVPHDLNGLAVKRLEIPYIVFGDIDYDRSIGHLKIFIKNRYIDEDGDGEPSLNDNCPFAHNIDQLNTDGADDGGDACDLDDDNDGVVDTADAYSEIPIGDLLDTDIDGAPNDCDETCIALGMAADDDDDNDSIDDNNDTYPLVAIGDLLDTDNDGAPDGCDDTCQTLGMSADADDDNDGIADIDDPFPLVANGDDNDDTWAYDIDGSNALVTGCVGTCPMNLAIPDTLGGYSVTSIGDYAFYNNQLTSVTIPDSVISIGLLAFGSNALTSLTIGNSVTTIGGAAFANNQLTSVTIPDSVTGIGYSAFYDNQLTSVTIPDSVTSIGYGLFAYNQLTSVSIPDSVTSIGDGAFKDNLLTSLTIGNNVTSIGDLAFSTNILSIVHFLGDRPAFSSESFDSNPLNTVTYCAGTSGWLGDPIEDITPINDCDGDGVLDADDAYPLIAIQNYVDSDKDGAPDECDAACMAIGMAADADDDNDGISDADEVAAGSDPLDPGNCIICGPRSWWRFKLMQPTL